MYPKGDKRMNDSYRSDSDWCLISSLILLITLSSLMLQLSLMASHYAYRTIIEEKSEVNHEYRDSAADMCMVISSYLHTWISWRANFSQKYTTMVAFLIFPECGSLIHHKMYIVVVMWTYKDENRQTNRWCKTWTSSKEIEFVIIIMIMIVMSIFSCHTALLLL